MIQPTFSKEKSQLSEQNTFELLIPGRKNAQEEVEIAPLFISTPHFYFLPPTQTFNVLQVDCFLL